MSIRSHQQDWEDLGELDPYWAVLSDPAQRYGNWDEQEFFRLGESDVNMLLGHATQLGYPTGRGRALDFGCALGRLTRALAKHWEECIGVDISATMIERARELNATEPKCTFLVNTNADLRLFPDDHFDLVCSLHVLQHNPNRKVIRSYLAEFVRVLHKDGLLAFNVPTQIPLRNRLQLRRRLYRVLRGLGIHEQYLYHKLGLNPIRMTFIPEHEVVGQLQSCGARVVGMEQFGDWGKMFFVTK
jgi:SAM-dependent methyltransferase